MPAYIPVAGTHGRTRDKEWVTSDSLFARYMSELGWTRTADNFGFWSTQLSGTFFCGSSHLAWQFGGDMLRRFLLTLPYEDRIVIAHSHGGNVAAYGVSSGVPIRALITVDSPVRRDMEEIWEAAVPHIGYHIHLYGTGFGSRMRWFGQRGRFKRRMPWADVNVRMKDHSSILRRQEPMLQMEGILFHLLKESPTSFTL